MSNKIITPLVWEIVVELMKPGERISRDELLDLVNGSDGGPFLKNSVGPYLTHFKTLGYLDHDFGEKPWVRTKKKQRPLGNVSFHKMVESVKAVKYVECNTATSQIPTPQPSVTDSPTNPLLEGMRSIQHVMDVYVPALEAENKELKERVKELEEEVAKAHQDSTDLYRQMSMMFQTAKRLEGK